MNKHTKISLFLLLALLFGVGVVWYTLWMSRVVGGEENAKIKLWAKATMMLVETDENQSVEVNNLLLDIIQSNNTIPVIVVDECDSIIMSTNISPLDELSAKLGGRSIFEEFRDKGEHILIPIADAPQHMYYKESILSRFLPVFLIAQFSIVILFLIIGYIALRNTFRQQQDKVWIGLSRETAHQLGTPITALIGWTDLLDEGNIDTKMVAAEIRKDTDRLRSIADRFSKIGSQPEMEVSNLGQTLQNVVDYLATRVSKNISLTVDTSEATKLTAYYNPVLIGWAVENLCRNAVDAIEGTGSITVRLSNAPNATIIDVVDTGKGMPRSTAVQIFEAGFTTKKRGWGIGLALSKRIVEQYHKGKIFVENTELKKGTTIRIVLPEA